MRPILLLALLLLAGCSTVETRIKERPTVFNTLPAKQQELILKGEVIEGMSKDAVYLAWGRPDDLVRGSENGQPYDEWVYTATTSDVVSSYSPSIRFYGRHYRDWDYIYDPVIVTHSYPYKSIRFVAGKAVAWRIAPVR